MRNQRIKEILEDRLLMHGAYKRLFETEDGKMVLRHLMNTGFIFTTTFIAGDPQRTALNEGSRRIVLSILRYINKTPQQLTEELEQQL